MTKDSGFVQAGYDMVLGVEHPYILKTDREGYLKGCPIDSSFTFPWQSVVPSIVSRGIIDSNCTATNFPVSFHLVGIRDSLFCTDSLYDTISYTHPSFLQIPNVFSPNSDGINDVFKITSGNIKNMGCLIFDRWGGKVAELKNPDEGWDGHNQTGGACNDGVYFYILDASGTDGTAYHRKGFIQLIR